MRNFFILFCLMVLLLPALATGQPTASLDSVKIWPPSPTSKDAISVEVYTSTNSVSTKIDFGHQVKNDTILIEACYEYMPLPSNQYYVDTIALGALKDGLYKIVYVGHTSPTTPCDPKATTIDTIQFTVLPPVSITALTNEDLYIYPNPVADVLYLRSAPNLQIYNAHIIDALGRVLKMPIENKTGTITLPELPAGVYCLEVVTNRGKILTRFLKN